MLLYGVGRRGEDAAVQGPVADLLPAHASGSAAAKERQRRHEEEGDAPGRARLLEGHDGAEHGAGRGDDVQRRQRALAAVEGLVVVR